MLAEIGIIVALYIITRMVSFLLRTENRVENIIVKILAVITIIISLVVIADLIISGFNITSGKHISSILEHGQKFNKQHAETTKKSEEPASFKPKKDVTFDPTRMSNEGYQELKWGMNKEEVTKLTGATQGDGFLINELKIAGEKAYILYYFTENKLYMVVIQIILETVNNDRYLGKFTEMEKLLIDKYGKPKKKEKIGSKNPYISNGDAIATGKAFYKTDWETPESKISLELWGDKFKIKFGVRYKSKKYEGLAEKERKEKTKGKL